MACLKATLHCLVVVLLLYARDVSAWMTGTVLSGGRIVSSSSSSSSRHPAKERGSLSLHGMNTPGEPGISIPVPFHHTAYDAIASETSALRLDDAGNAWLPQRQRPRRNRKSPAMRDAVRENTVTPSDFVYPLFIHDEVSVRTSTVWCLNINQPYKCCIVVGEI